MAGKKPPLSITHPELAKQADGWDPATVTAGSGKRRAWKCELGHSWQAAVNDRSFGYGCPFCAGQRALPGFNDLATINPELAKQADGWDPTTVTAGSKRKLPWKCQLGHQWTATVKNRTRLEANCPICSGQVALPGFNDLATISPELAKQADGWDPTTVTAGSGTKQLWRCPNGHNWRASINSRNGSRHGCPICSGQVALPGFNDLATINPELAKQADGWDPTTVTAGSKRKLPWKCQLGHQWTATVKDRKKAGCPICSGNRVLTGFNDLATINPELAKEWHPSKNDKLPTQVTAGSQQPVWWFGKECGHEWRTSPGARRGCPFCSGNRVLTGFNDLATINPELAKEWHPSKNDKLPTQVTAGSPSKAWWLCHTARHEWRATVASRNNGIGCPSCAKHGFDPSQPGWLYLLEHEVWDLLKIGITNNRDQRTGLHVARGWTLIDLRGPMDGSLCKDLERSILEMLRSRGARFAHKSDRTKFDGWTESWFRSSFETVKIRDLVNVLNEDDLP